jgi:hypothetical protein
MQEFRAKMDQLQRDAEAAEPAKQREREAAKQRQREAAKAAKQRERDANLLEFRAKMESWE